MPRYQDSGRCRGYAHVSFTNAKTAHKALSFTGQKLKGRYLDIKEAEGQRASLNREQISKYTHTFNHSHSSSLAIIHSIIRLQ